MHSIKPLSTDSSGGSSGVAGASIFRLIKVMHRLGLMIVVLFVMILIVPKGLSLGAPKVSAATL